jgi:hypothetical protein
MMMPDTAATTERLGPPELPAGLNREIFISMPLGFKLNRNVLIEEVSDGRLSEKEAKRLLREDGFRKALNAVLDYYNYWQLQRWRQQIESCGRWVPPPPLPDRDRAAVWDALYGPACLPTTTPYQAGHLVLGSGDLCRLE